MPRRYRRRLKHPAWCLALHSDLLDWSHLRINYLQPCRYHVRKRMTSACVLAQGIKGTQLRLAGRHLCVWVHCILSKSRIGQGLLSIPRRLQKNGLDLGESTTTSTPVLTLEFRLFIVHNHRTASCIHNVTEPCTPKSFKPKVTKSKRGEFGPDSSFCSNLIA